MFQRHYKQTPRDLKNDGAFQGREIVYNRLGFAMYVAKKLEREAETNRGGLRMSRLGIGI